MNYNTVHACADLIESVTRIPADLLLLLLLGVVTEEKLRLLAVWDSGSYLDM